MLILPRQPSASACSRSAEMSRPRPQRRDRADADVLGDRPERKDPVGLAVAGDERDRCGHLDARRAPAGAVEDAEEQLRLAVTGEPGEADDLALMGDELGTVALARGPGADADRRARRGHGLPPPRPARGRGGSAPPMIATSLSRSKARGDVGGDDLAVAHDDDAVAILEDLAEEMRDQDMLAPAARRRGGRRREADRRYARRARRSARRG